ncbi:MAG: heavy metal-binding domain-containing protein, partial [Candidatus Pacebacteria bacterium]|nr:heavy metal-binding domain-containing protein [Candidatus Paceibacterota bacterium]MBP9842736.1 heavy metal-binding domain-containing protein [Candidatus Paceibacterota bacterium]
EIKGYVIALNDARTQATNRMVEEAETMGADAIVCMRYSTSQVMAGGAEILAYGTAVKLQ